MRANTANRHGLDYAAEAARFDQSLELTDVHSHINGARAAEVYRRAARAYGVKLTYSMTALDNLEAVREVLGQSIRFIAVPHFEGKDRKHSFGAGFLENVEKFHAAGARVVKFWCAPRGRDIGREVGDPDLLKLGSPRQLEVMELARSLGMAFMTHVGDPDTWFATRYRDASLYGSKLDQYEPLREMLQRFDGPWIAAHMGGWPEDLEFLSSMLTAHPNLYLDTSATKWMARELSKHTRQDLLSFLDRFRGRIMFGSDIVTSDKHLDESAAGAEGGPAYAYDLYASRYYALRTLFETDYRGESPIVDPDLHMLDPQRYGPDAAPELCGKFLPRELVDVIYRKAAEDLLSSLYGRSDS